MATKKASATRSTAKKSAPKAQARPNRATAADIGKRAAEQLAELTGREVEGVTGVENGDDGWIVSVEVVEIHRIPDTSDILAEYEVRADEQGELTGYQRRGRYSRGQLGGGR